MAEFLTTHGISSKIEEILINAKKFVYLVSPFLQISKTFYERLLEASDNVELITIVYGKEDLKPNEWNNLVNLKKMELYFFENLHAKCYFNESNMVITSMNMYEYSLKNNREMGILINSKSDLKLYEAAKKEAFSIIKNAEAIKTNKSDRALFNDPEFKSYISSTTKDYNQVIGDIVLDAIHEFL